MQETRTLRIEHDHADGTRLYGTRRADDLYKELRSQGWLPRRSCGDYRLQGSVDKPAKMWVIDRTAGYLRGLGFEVQVDIDNAMRSMEQAEADRGERADDRADRLNHRADRLGREADGRHQAADRLAEQFAFGQPILVGHHSERRARRDQERIHNNMRKSIALGKEAARTADAADSAARHMEHRYSPVTVANRIKTLEAEQRRTQRYLDGYERKFYNGRGALCNVEKHQAATGEHRERLTTEAAHIAEQLRYWQKVRAEQVAEGKATSFGPADVAKGDMVRYGGTWYPVVRVNKVSVTIPSIVGCSWTDTAPFHKLRAVARQDTPEWRAAAVECVARADVERAHKAVVALVARVSEMVAADELTADNPQGNFVSENRNITEEATLLTVETPSLFGNDIKPIMDTPGLFDDTPELAVAPTTRRKPTTRPAAARREAASGELFAIELTEGDTTTGFGFAII